MADSLVAKVRAEVSEDISSEIIRILCLYCCRILDSGPAKAWIRSLLKPDQIAPLYAVKYELDDSVSLNNYWRAVHSISHYKRPPKQVLRETSVKYKIPYVDISEMVKSLYPGELSIINRSRTFLRKPYTEPEVKYCLDLINKHIKAIAGRRLRYVADNDCSRDREDMVAELIVHAMRLIRRYEIEAENYNHIAALTVRGLQNHSKNLAVYANRASRKVLQRLVTQPNFKEAWWFDETSMSIRRVIIPKKGKRSVVNDNGKEPSSTVDSLCCEVVLNNDGTIKYAPVDHLYNDQREALTARRKFRFGKDPSRKRIIDLNSSIQDDWASTTISIDRNVSRDSGTGGGLTLGDIISSTRIVGGDHADFLIELNQNATGIIQDFTACILGKDLFFIDYLEEKGINAFTANERKLGTEACRFLGVSIRDVKKDLERTPESIWTNDKIKKRIYGNV